MISGLTLAGGDVHLGDLEGNTSGGGILNRGTLTLRDSIARDSTALAGGGIFNEFSATMTIHNTSIANNDALENDGGGIANKGVMTVRGSTLADNETFASSGGGIANTGTLTVVNSTLSGNTALLAGGGLSNSGNLTVVSSTITGNRAIEHQGGGVRSLLGVAALHNTLVAGNVVGAAAESSPDDIFGQLDPSSSFNLVGVDTGLTGISDGQSGNQVGTTANPIDPRLAPLADNGGLTPTHALLPGSPALDRGRSADAPAVDQRGRPRGRADIGAFEAHPWLSAIADRTIPEDTGVAVRFTLGDRKLAAALPRTRVSATSDNPTLIPDGRLVVLGTGSRRTLILIPRANQHGTATISLTASAGGESMTTQFRLTVAPVNDAPVLKAHPVARLTPIDNLTTDPPGDLVGDLLAGRVSDRDDEALRGIAVIGLGSSARGDWQFSLDNGTTWTSFGVVTPGQARLLRDTDRVRFVPRPTFIGQAAFSYRAWDQTTGSAGATANVRGRERVGGTRAFSAVVGVARLAVHA
jgi:hypothetical protein